MDEKAKIREKIAKLMALATNEGAADNEAETALRQAEKLMRKHNIDLAEVHASTGKLPSYLWSTELVPAAWPKPVKQAPLWFGWICLAVAKFTDTVVDLVNTPDRGQCARFKGTDMDVEYAIWLADHIRTQIRVRANAYDAPGINSDQKWANREEFRHSMARRICARIDALIAERKEVYKSTGTALIVVNDKLAQRDAQFGKQQVSTRHRSHIRGTADAYYAGRDAGDKVQIHRPVGDATDKPRLT